MGAPVETTVSPRDRILIALDKLPPFSPVLARLLATLANEDVSFGALAGIIETDAVLAGNLLRVVNSPLYGRISTINSVKHSVAILGITKIRNLVLGLSVSRRWAGTRVPSMWIAKEFNIHSLAVAVMADQVALRTSVPYPEGAFTAGLLHDVGKLLIAVSSPDQFVKIHQIYKSGGDSIGDCEEEILGVTHAEVSGAILERWKLPKPIHEATAFHHRPGLCNGGVLHLAHVIQAADLYVNTAGFGMPPYRYHPAASFDDCELSFGLKDRVLEAAKSFQAEFEAVRAFF